MATREEVKSHWRLNRKQEIREQDLVTNIISTMGEVTEAISKREAKQLEMFQKEAGKALKVELFTKKSNIRARKIRENEDGLKHDQEALEQRVLTEALFESRLSTRNLAVSTSNITESSCEFLLLYIKYMI